MGYIRYARQVLIDSGNLSVVTVNRQMELVHKEEELGNIELYGSYSGAVIDISEKVLELCDSYPGDLITIWPIISPTDNDDFFKINFNFISEILKSGETLTQG